MKEQMNRNARSYCQIVARELTYTNTLSVDDLNLDYLTRFTANRH